MNLFFLCIKIFFARILDVSISTVRTNVMLKGKHYISTFLAFIEVFIWFVVAREALMIDVDSIFIPISYSLGYASGTLIGSFLSTKFIHGIVAVQVVVDENNERILKELKAKDYAVSVIELKNNYDGNERMMLYMQINNRSLKKVEKIIHRCDPDAFLAVSDTKMVENGYIR